jgi:hypothetical protein
VYSLGALCCKLLTGCLPPDPEGDEACDVHGLLSAGLAEADPQGESDAQHRLLDPVAAILAKAFSREPSQRFATADVMAEGIQGCLDSLEQPPA